MDLREEFLRTCFEPFDGEFASGKKANNKIEAENIYDHNELFEAIALRLGQAVLEHNPEFVVGVPDGATKLADAVALRCDLQAVHLKRTGPNREKMEFKDNFLDREVICRPLSRGVLIEDVFNEFTNTRKSLAIPELSERIVAVVGILDRGPRRRQEPAVPCRALIRKRIPNELWRYSRMWKYADSE